MSVPRNEYPRPDMVRRDDTWINLNGKWEFEFDFGDSGKDRGLWESEHFSREIIVPFVPESKLSGIEHTDFIIACWYKRSFDIPAKWDTTHGRVLIHFGAVDYFCDVRINGRPIANHRGGFTPFTFDITDAVKTNANKIVIRVVDNGKSGKQPLGKQVYESYGNFGCFYTRSTGIWQTVWLEYVPKNYIKTLKMTPDIDNEKLDVTVKLEGENSAIDYVRAEASFKGTPVASVEVKVCGKEAAFSIPVKNPKLWDINDPNLYDLTLYAGDDKIDTYFGMRSIKIKGMAIELNNKPLFQRLVLDQGYYEDGIYTAPTDDDLKRDIIISKEAGFNGARLHMKVFEPRFLYYADKLGYIVWGEFPMWGLNINSDDSLLHILPEWLTELERDYNHPSIVGWCPYNETTKGRNCEAMRTIYNVTKAFDPMRPVIDTSGYVHVITDIYDVHDYDQNPSSFEKRYRPLADGEGKVFVNHAPYEKYEGQPYFVSEFGGTFWDGGVKSGEEQNAAWGYGDAPKTIEEFYERTKGLVDALLDNPRICAFCYTQLTNVFQEQNGLYNFDRSPKFDVERLHAIFGKKAAIEWG